MNVTLHNYTIRINKAVAHVVPASELMLSLNRLELTEETLPAGITLGGSFQLSVTACTDIACRTSDPVMLSKYIAILQSETSYIHILLVL